MSGRRLFLIAGLSATLGACSTTTPQGTLAELQQLPADVEEIYLEDSLERAAESYRRYLEETSERSQRSRIRKFINLPCY